MSALLGYLWREFLKYGEEQKSIKNSVLSSLEYRMKEIYMNCVKLNKIPFYKKQEFYKLYTDYKALGGNGAYEDMSIEIKKLPIE